MRLFSTALFAGFVMTLAASSLGPESDRGPTEVEPVSVETSDIDPIVTGSSISEEQKAKWLKSRKAYLECPECVASQPYPGD